MVDSALWDVAHWDNAYWDVMDPSKSLPSHLRPYRRRKKWLSWQDRFVRDYQPELQMMLQYLRWKLGLASDLSEEP